MESRLILFPHVGRTGGDYLQRVVQKSLPAGEVRHCGIKQNSWKYLSSVSDEALNKLKFLSGHGIYYGLHEQIRRECTYTVLCRDPVDRVISQYFIYLIDPLRDLHKLIKEQNISLEEFATNWTNEHANYILGHDSYRTKKPELSDLNEAIEVLERDYCFVGTTEYWHPSFYLLSKRLGINSIPLVGRTLVNDNRPKVEEVPQSTRDLIADAHRLDMEIHRYATARVEKEMATLTQQDRQIIQRWQQILNDATSIDKELDPQIFNVDFVKSCYGQGPLNVVIIDAIEQQSNIVEQTKHLLSSLNTCYGCQIQVVTTVRIPTLSGFTPEKYNSELRLETINQRADAVIIIAPAGKSFLIREPLIDAGIPREKFKGLFREIL